MAEEIRLVGSFDDQITGKLRKLNQEIARISKNFQTLGNKLGQVEIGLKGVAKHARNAGNELESMGEDADRGLGALDTAATNIARISHELRDMSKDLKRGAKAYTTFANTVSRQSSRVVAAGRRAGQVSNPFGAAGGRARRATPAGPNVSDVAAQMPRGSGTQNPYGMSGRRPAAPVPYTGPNVSDYTYRPSSIAGRNPFTASGAGRKPAPVSVVSNPAAVRAARQARSSPARQPRSARPQRQRGPSSLTLFGPMVRAGIALDMIRFASSGLIETFKNLAESGRQAELGMIQMANVIQTVGQVGDFGASVEIAKTMRENLARIAVELPGGTNDYITIQTRILDDMIISMGSLGAVQQDLEKGADSFVGLFGTFARLAGLTPELAARDLDQLRRSPQSLRHVEILTRNANLMSAYEAEILKTPKDFFGALYRAMEKSMTKQTLEAVKNTFDVAFETIQDTLFNEIRGVFGSMRETGIVLQGEFYDAGVTMMDSLGIMTRHIGEVFKLFGDAVGTGPLQALNSVLFEVALLFYVMRLRVAQAKGQIEDAFFDMFRDLFANLTEWVASLDYQQFFHYVDRMIASIFEGIGLGFKRASENGENKSAIGTTVSGTVLAFLALSGAMNKLGFSFSALFNSLKGIPKSFAYLRQELAVFRQLPVASMRGAGAAAVRGGAKGIFASAIKGAKVVGKRLLILGGIIEMVSDLMEGKTLTEAFASGLGNIGGTALGAGIGTLIAPGIGTAIGAVLGGMIGGSDAVSAPLSATLSEVMGAFDGLLMSLNAIIAPFNDIALVIPGISGDFNILSAILSAVLSPFALLEIGLYGLAAMINWAIEQVSWGEARENARRRRLEAEGKMQNANDRFTITRRRDMGGYSLATQLEAEDEKLREAIKKGNDAEIERIRAYRNVILELMGKAPGPKDETPPKDQQNKPATPDVPKPSVLDTPEGVKQVSAALAEAYPEVTVEVEIPDMTPVEPKPDMDPSNRFFRWLASKWFSEDPEPANKVQEAPPAPVAPPAPAAPVAPPTDTGAMAIRRQISSQIGNLLTQVTQLNTTFVTYLESLIALNETTNSELGSVRSSLGDISGKLTSPMSVRVTNLSEIKIDVPEPVVPTTEVPNTVQKVSEQIQKLERSYAMPAVMPQSETTRLTTTGANYLGQVSLAPESTTANVQPSAFQTNNSSASGPINLNVNNTFNAAEMDQEQMANAVSESIMRAVDEAGYREVFTS